MIIVLEAESLWECRAREKLQDLLAHVNVLFSCSLTCYSVCFQVCRSNAALYISGSLS